MKRYRWLIPVIIVALAVLVSVVRYTQRGAGANPGEVRASGTIEATEVHIAFRMPGILARRPIDEGDTVAAGDVIAVLDSREAEARLREAEAAGRVAEAALNELERGFRSEEVAQAEAALREAAVQMRNLAEQAERSEVLFADGGLSREQRDRDRAAAAAARARHEAARERLRLLQHGHRIEQVEAARARLDQARAAADILRVNLEDMSARSPIAGVVTRTHAEVGETLGAGRPVAAVADLARPRLRVYITERQIGRVALGAPATVSVDAFPERGFSGRVSFVAAQAEFTPKNVQTLEERVKLVFAVDIELDNPEGIFKPGMPADVVIETLSND